MPKGYSFHIGLNSVDPDHYDGWSGPLNACEADVISMERICKKRGFQTETIKTKQATRDNVLGRLEKLATECASGDTLIISYSGHGGQMPDENGDESDALDETWCLYDGQVIDDELYRTYCKFAAGVRIAVFSDSCHSGSVIRQMMLGRSLLTAPWVDQVMSSSRLMPPEIQARTYAANQSFYQEILERDAPQEPACTVVLVSGCQDNQLSQDGTFNGAFTGALVRVWNSGGFKGGYSDFTKAIRAKLPADQSPNFMVAGAANSEFTDKQVFSF